MEYIDAGIYAVLVALSLHISFLLLNISKVKW
jgi:hypothetical protein